MAGDERATVLVVEDSAVNRRALVRGVERDGHRVLEATDGAAALEMLDAEPVDMVLLDLVMPGMDGFEVLARMGRDSRLGDVPVLVISAVEDAHDVARAIELGAIDCLPKPFDPILLRVRLRVGLEQARLRRIEQDYLRQELALRQQERLATLGRLSAGLGHELNNPAAAALSTVRHLRDEIDTLERLLADLVGRPDGADLVAQLDGLVAGGDRGGTADVAEPTDPAAARGAAPGTAAGVEHLEDLLAAAGLSRPWDLADDLARLGVTPERLADRLPGLGTGAEPALHWLVTRARLHRRLDHLGVSVGRMAELTRALRGYSNLDRAPRRDVDVRTGIDETVTMLAHKVGDEVEVVVDHADDLPVVEASPGELNQVWTNLLDNALDAVDGHGRVVVTTHLEDDSIVVEVADDGPGIPEELQGRVFDPFVTTKPPGEGTGLGLNISHRIVTDVHDGRMSVASTPAGTTFRVTLPLQAPATQEDS